MIIIIRQHVNTLEILFEKCRCACGSGLWICKLVPVALVSIEEGIDCGATGTNFQIPSLDAYGVGG
jgi:hypothetical protein